ncbi:HTH domain-containing protein, partial [Erysipelothrix rhusiopathiae]|nr:HTH domain-containing protein [Erysipelothrix rhusiopathiae]
MEFTNRQLIIMHHLAQGNTVTAQELALSSNVSIRTIKKEIQILREILKSYQIEVSSIPGHGYRLNPLDEDQEEKIFENIGSISLIRRMNSFSRNNSERVSFLIRTLLQASDYLKIEDLAERMFVSRTTIHNDLKDVRLQLRRFQLELKSRPAYGLKLTGSEFNLRLAFAEYFFHNTLSLVESKEKEPFILSKETLFKTEEIVKESCFKANILLSDFSLQNIAVHILILFKRRREGHRIDIHKTTDSLLLPLARTIANAVSTLLNEDVLEKPELLYLAIHLDSKQIIAHSGKTDAQDEALIYDIFTEIDNNFAINFLDNHELFRYLLLH